MQTIVIVQPATRTTTTTKFCTYHSTGQSASVNFGLDGLFGLGLFEFFNFLLNLGSSGGCPRQDTSSGSQGGQGSQNEWGASQGNSSHCVGVLAGDGSGLGRWSGNGNLGWCLDLFGLDDGSRSGGWRCHRFLLLGCGFLGFDWFRSWWWDRSWGGFRLLWRSLSLYWFWSRGRNWNRRRCWGSLLSLLGCVFIAKIQVIRNFQSRLWESYTSLRRSKSSGRRSHQGKDRNS